MFCKWCGKKITNNGLPCPSCGRNQEPLESGNGFWDLCDDKPAVYHKSFKAEQNPPQKPEFITGPATDNPTKKGTKSLFKTLHIVTIFMLLIAIIEMFICIVTTNRCLAELKTVHSEISNLNERLDNEDTSVMDYFNNLLDSNNN